MHWTVVSGVGYAVSLAVFFGFVMGYEFTDPASPGVVAVPMPVPVDV